MFQRRLHIHTSLTRRLNSRAWSRDWCALRHRDSITPLRAVKSCFLIFRRSHNLNELYMKWNSLYRFHFIFKRSIQTMPPREIMRSSIHSRDVNNPYNYFQDNVRNRVCCAAHTPYHVCRNRTNIMCKYRPFLLSMFHFVSTDNTAGGIIFLDTEERQKRRNEHDRRVDVA